MAQTLMAVVLFVGAVAMLPWLVRYLQQRRVVAQAGLGVATRVLSAVAVGPHQRVVTVEVGSDGAKVCLVLGVTAQQVSCLHVMQPVALSVPPGAGFAQVMAKAAQSDASGQESRHV